MKINHTVKMGLVGFGILVLAGCSTPGTGVSSDKGTEADKTATSGIGNDNDLGGSGSGVKKKSTLQVEDQTYYFDFDKSEIHAEDRASIDVQGHYLASHQNAKVLLEGNTDPQGSREYNIALGERRANAVADILKLDGASKDQVRVVSYGAEKLASQGHTEADYELDRRVNLVYEAK